MLELACVGAWSDGVSLALLDADDMSMRRLLVDGYVCDIYDDLARPSCGWVSDVSTIQAHGAQLIGFYTP